MFENFEDFEPLYFLDFSKEILQKSDSFEVNQTTIKRIAYNRIYFATFLFVREWLKLNCNYKSSKRDHTQMLNFINYNGPFNKILNHKIRDYLSLLKRLRHQVDYYITIPEAIGIKENWQETSIEIAFELSRFIIELFEEYELNN